MNKKKLLALVLVFLMFAMALPSFTAHADDTDVCSLNLFIDDGEYPAGSVSVTKGNTPDMPDDPMLAEHTFFGWYADKALTVPFDFSAPMYEDADIYARFVPDSEVVYLVFWFGPDDPDPLAGQHVEKGTTPIRPDDPAPASKTFLGWFANKALTVPFDFSAAMYEDANAYACFVNDEDVIHLNMWLHPDDEHPVGSQILGKGRTPVRPDDPMLADHTFFGWFADKALTVPFDFSTAMDENADIYARFVPDSDLVTYCWYLGPDDPFPAAGIDHEKGTKPAMPPEPAREGMTFEGWFADKALTIPFDFDVPLYEDTDIYAKWTPNYVWTETPSEWTGEGDLGFVAKSSGETDVSFEKFQSATMDEEPLDPSNYDVVEGSVKLTLKASYLQTLPAGEHVLGIVFAGNVAVKTKFEIKSETPQPTDPPATETPQPTDPPATETPQPTAVPATETPQPTDPPATETPQPTDPPATETPQPTAVPETEAPQPTAVPTNDPGYITPKTGDESSLMLWSLLCLGSAFSLAFLLRDRRRKPRKTR